MKTKQYQGSTRALEQLVLEFFNTQAAKGIVKIPEHTIQKHLLVSSTVYHAQQEMEKRQLNKALGFLLKDRRIIKVGRDVYSLFKNEKRARAKPGSQIGYISKKKLQAEDDQEIMAVYWEQSHSYQIVNYNDDMKIPACPNDVIFQKEDDSEGVNSGLKNGNLVMITVRREERRCFGTFKSLVAESYKGQSTIMTLHEMKIPVGFPEEVMKEVNALPSKLSSKDYKERKDLRHLPLVTIDSEDSRDFDDAVCAEPWIEKGERRGTRVWVAIADVAHYVPKDSATDLHAKMLGNSTYLYDRCNPMLPERLSNNLCSLVPNEDRPVLAFELLVDNDGELYKFKFFRAVMHSVARLTYRQVQRALEGDFNGVVGKDLYDKSLKHLAHVYKQRRDHKVARQALELDKTETYFITDDNGNIESVQPRKRVDSHKLIEEMMILANIAAATVLNQEASIYRVHDKPSNAKVRSLLDHLSNLGINHGMTLHGDEQYFGTEKFLQIVELIKDRPDVKSLTDLITRTQTKATYHCRNTGHYGLALEGYSHSTSPIRRYSDLMLHRQIIAVLGLPGKGGYHYSDTKIFKDCEIINKCERISSNAEKMASKRAIAEYHEGDLDKVFEVTVSGVSLLGISVKIADTHAEGLVFSEELKAIGYQLNEQQTEIVKVVGRGVPIRLGTKLNVRLKEVDILKGRLSFEYLSFADIQPVLDFKDIIAA